MSDERGDRLLSDGDVKAIVSELKHELIDHFQREVGKGVLGFVWKIGLITLLLLAVYGALGDKQFLRGIATAVNGGAA